VNRIVIGIIAFVAWTALAFWMGREWRDRSADLTTATIETATVKESLTAEQGARAVEHQQAAATQGAADKATTREDKIDADYDERIAAAVAGRDSELGRIRKLWAGCETDRLSGGAAAAAEAAEQDRLRRASAARIVRACELAQSERDETIDRYNVIAGTGPAQAVTPADQVKP
jgi:phosphate starvation-inducible protein PhoH